MTEKKTEHAVIIQFFDFVRFWNETSRDLSPLFTLEDELEAALKKSDAGVLDGHEIAVDGSDGYIYLYGPDADALYAAVELLLRASAVTQGGNATLRYGRPGEPNILRKYIEIKPLAH